MSGELSGLDRLHVSSSPADDGSSLGAVLCEVVGPYLLDRRDARARARSMS